MRGSPTRYTNTQSTSLLNSHHHNLNQSQYVVRTSVAGVAWDEVAVESMIFKVREMKMKKRKR